MEGRAEIHVQWHPHTQQLARGASEPELRQGSLTSDALTKLAQASAEGTMPEFLAKANHAEQAAPRSPEEIKKAIRHKVRGIVTSRSGASFEERSALSAAKFRAQAAVISRRQKDLIEEAVRRGRAQPNSSVLRDRTMEPESVGDRVARGVKDVRRQTQEYWGELAGLRQKMATREPLYKLEEVAAAELMLKERQVQRKRELREDEEQRWKMIRGIQEKVIDRPLAMEEFRRKEHSAGPAYAVPEEPFGIDKKIQIAIAKRSFQESSWRQEVQSIHERADNRPKLHEIKYPPKVHR